VEQVFADGGDGPLAHLPARLRPIPPGKDEIINAVVTDGTAAMGRQLAPVLKPAAPPSPPGHAGHNARRPPASGG
jgi:hypothetical protein